MFPGVSRGDVSSAVIQAVDIIAAALKALGNAKPDIARALLELAVAVLAAGEVMRVLSRGDSAVTRE